MAVTNQELNDGTGMAAYFLVLELIGLLEGMGIEKDTVTTLMTRARVKAEEANRAGKSKAGHTALQLLQSLEQQRTAGRRPSH